MATFPVETTHSTDIPLSIQHKIFLHAFEHHFGQPVDLMMSMVIAVVPAVNEPYT